MAAVLEISHGMQIAITQVSKLESIDSSEVLIYGIPWKIKVFKHDADEGNEDDDEKEDKSWLGIQLICGSTDESLGWSIPGGVSCKLLPFDENLDAHEFYHGPTFFDRASLLGRCSELIAWDDLFDADKKYVKDDTIKLEFKIEVENQNDPNRSSVQFECIKKSCDCESSATFRLTVKNVSNLMAVRTPRFDLRGLSWIIAVGKDSSSNLFADLEFDDPTNKISCNVTCLVKLLSSKTNIKPIELTQTAPELRNTNILSVNNIVSWKELFKPKNGFVNNDSMTLDVEIETNKPRGEGANDLPIAKRAKLNPENEAKTPQMECPICFKCIANQELAVTPCGHLFCFECIKKAITGRAACPACNKVVRSNTLRHLYLPGVH